MSSTSRWTEVRVVAPIEWSELVAETLQLGPCTSVAFGPPTPDALLPAGRECVRTFLPAEDDTPSLRASITARIAALASTSGDPALALSTVEFVPLPPEDYANAWKKSWRAFRVGRIAVVAPWSKAQPRASDLVMRLEPGSSFGSGRHATTRMMLRALQTRMRPGERVVDVGAGSGILAVAAAMLGASHAFGFDVDPQSERAANELARENCVDARCRFATGGCELLEASPESFDGLMSNLYSDAIRAHAADLARALKPGGWFAISGISAETVEPTLRAIADAGLVVERRAHRGRWHAFDGVRDRARS